jgi:hypothetical protein
VAKTKLESFNVAVAGVGRKDYSQDVQYSVEPIIRSYQLPYVLDEVYTVGAGQTRTIDVSIPSQQVGNRHYSVVLLYDFLASCLANALIGFQVQAVDADGTVGSIFNKSGYQKVEHHHSRGAPVFRTIRIILTNYHSVALDINVSLHGVYTSREEYFMTVVE